MHQHQFRWRSKNNLFENIIIIFKLFFYFVNLVCFERALICKAAWNFFGAKINQPPCMDGTCGIPSYAADSCPEQCNFHALLMFSNFVFHRLYLNTTPTAKFYALFAI
jgi:hypothetical protein